MQKAKQAKGSGVFLNNQEPFHYMPSSASKATQEISAHEKKTP